MSQLNYLRKAEDFVAKQMMPWLKENHPEDAEVCGNFLHDANEAIKFILPDGGHIFDDGLKGIEDLDELHLPFESVLIEYRASKAPGLAAELFGEENTRPYPRRIVLANEQDEFICVYSMVGMAHDGNEAWVMQPMCVVMTKSKELQATERSIKATKHPIIKGLSASMVPTGSLFNTMYSGDREEWAWADMSDEFIAVLELIEALSCSNVTHEALPVPKQNKAAIRRGTRPFDEYRVLVVKNEKKQYEERGGSHASPREHLRRGHIRNLQNGNRIWINSCVVNAGVGGRIQKDYDMRKVLKEVL